MNYESIASIVSSAASASNPTLWQHLVMLVKSSRPPGWTFGPILYGIGAIHSGAIPKSLGSLAVCVAQIATLSFPLCIVVFGVNDVYDYASDLLNPRKSATSLEGTILPPAYHAFVHRAAVTSSALTVGVSLLPYLFTQPASGLLQTYAPVVSTSALVALGWMYSAPPFRLKEVPVVDSISNGLIVWLSWFIGFSSCCALAGRRWDIATIPSKGYVLGLVTASVHALGAAADIEADVAAGQRTVATVLGRRGCAIIGAAAYAVALTTESPASIFGAYLAGGLGVMLSVCVYPSPAWVHRAFQVIVFWTVGMSVLWFGARLGGKSSN
ncbi:UbiA family prenyltransferase [Ceratobasidium sp. AG-Ba]|nr:UbiA family prenyltransferase [Ceratobasidium sp. AG-Ba]